MKKSLIVIALLTLLCCSACKKTCRCYRYDGSGEEFTKEELNEMGYSCAGLEDINLGLTYSICEWVF
ncbi:MAG: hypothetical protein K5864_04925 [Bacteroidales bacterium]|nr:hypothetical protein [Bacteroidales bacterium]